MPKGQADAAVLGALRADLVRVEVIEAAFKQAQREADEELTDATGCQGQF